MEKSMTKFKFNALDLEEQIKYFNLKLQSGFKIIEICSEVSISYNTIRDRFKRNNYVYNKLSRQYECIENIFPIDKELIEKTLEKIVTKVFNQNNTTSQTNADKLICDNNLDGKVINRSFRIYDNVLQDFTKFCDKSNYNQYDILSKFISEGIKKYSNI